MVGSKEFDNNPPRVLSAAAALPKLYVSPVVDEPVPAVIVVFVPVPDSEKY
jgi:hypothetical protein